MISREYSNSVSGLRWLVVPLLAFASACATTSTVNRASQLADAGVAYGDTLATLVGVTESSYIDWNSRSLLDRMKGTASLQTQCSGASSTKPGCDKLPGELQKLPTMLADDDKAVGANVVLFDLLRAQLRVTAAYFAGLQTLASYDAATPGGAALEGLANSINGLSQQISKQDALKEDQVVGAKSLGEWVGRQYKAKVIRDVLARDELVISNALAWQDKVLEFMSTTLGSFLDQAKRRSYHTSVQTPYAAVAVSDAEKWVESRRLGLTSAPQAEQLEAARRASTSMRSVWQQILVGAQDPALAMELLGELRDLNESLAKLTNK